MKKSAPTYSTLLSQLNTLGMQGHKIRNEMHELEDKLEALRAKDRANHEAQRLAFVALEAYKATMVPMGGLRISLDGCLRRVK